MNFGLKSIKIANSWTLLSRKEEMTLVQTLIQLIAAVYCLNLGADFIFDFFNVLCGLFRIATLH